MEGLDSLTREELVALVQSLFQQVQSLTQEVTCLREQLSGKGAGQPPAFVKPARPSRPRSAASVLRRSRGGGRRRPRCAAMPPPAAPTAGAPCPAAGNTGGGRSSRSGGWEHRRRQVIEVPQAPVQVTDHVTDQVTDQVTDHVTDQVTDQVTVARWCGVCRKRVLPNLDLSAEVVGRHRVGVRLMSLVGWLHTAGRLPLRTVQSVLRALYGLRLSVGELAEVLHTLAAQGKTEYARPQQQVRGSPFIHADETGWREDGQNGYLWSFSTPSVRYFHCDQSRGGAVPQEVLGEAPGEAFGGVTVCDFYGGYNGVGSVRQRCWVHFLRDLHTLTEAHREDAGVQEWARAVRAVYDAAREWQEKARQALARHGGAAGDFGFGVFDRRRRRREMEARLYALAQPWLKRAVPQRVLSERMERFLPELFVFVEHPAVPSENNAAECALRPCVIGRKVSGGTRSAKGSATKSVLLSLFGTWQAQGQDALEACRRMLTQPVPAVPSPAA